MSNALFPSLPGLAFDVGKSPMFSTAIQTAVSGRELRRANRAHPVYQFGLNFEFLRDELSFNELKTLAGFYMQRQGSFDSFLFTDPDDSIAFNQQFGVGDGVTTQFQLSREFGGAVEPVSNIDTPSLSLGPLLWSPNGNQSIWGVDGGLMWGADSNLFWSAAPSFSPADYTVSATGLITFAVAPALGDALVWNGSFYYRCRFSDDQIDFNKFMEQLWSLKTCDLIGSLGNKI